MSWKIDKKTYTIAKFILWVENMSKNYYEILWVEKTSSNDEIKKAYRKMAMQHHPDRWWDAEMFKQVNEAYGVLWDEQKRNQYDTFWRVGGGNPFWGWFSWGVDVDLWDIFEQFFWGSRQWSSRRKSSQNIPWEDLEYVMSIDLKTSIFWGKQKISFEKKAVCTDCKWVGGEWKKSCWDCHGSGYVKYRQQSIFGTIEHTWPCEKCHGSGEIIEKICHTCHGQKRVNTKVEHEIEIPAWIDTGMVIKLSWEWNEWVAWDFWDLYIKFRVQNEEKWLVRDGVDLHYHIEIDVIEAILGTQKELNIPVLGKRVLTIDAGTQVGSIIKLSWDGVKHIDSEKKWDLYVELEMKVPKKLSQKERDLYEQIAKEKKLNVHNKKWIFEKIFG